VRALPLTGAALTVVLLGGCVAPPLDSSAFTGDAVASLEAVTSSTRTAELALTHWLDGDLPSPYADVVVTDSETAIGPVSSVFGGVDPPDPGADALRETVLGLLDDAGSAAADGRIALRRGDRAGVRKAAHDLASVSEEMERLGEALQ